VQAHSFTQAFIICSKISECALDLAECDFRHLHFLEWKDEEKGGKVLTKVSSLTFVRVGS
jgi:hypothetical protein